MSGTCASGTIVVAVDGPSGSGKSSVSRAVARRFGLRYLDTGATYRAMTWWMLRAAVAVDDPDAVAARCGEPVIEAGTDPAAPTIHVDGTDVAAAIRGLEVTAAVSAVSAVPAVRARLVALQRDAIGTGGVVVEGRDIGTAVAPDAAVKVFLTAAVAARAARRAAELRADPSAVADVPVEATAADLGRRDALDAGRAASPLAKAPDAVEIDATALSFDQVVARVAALVEEVIGPAASARPPEGGSAVAATSRATR